MPNEAAFAFLNNKITGLEIIKQELGRMFLSTSDLGQADLIRTEITSINQILFALESARNSLAATENEVPPPPAARVQSLTAALQRLDKFVSGDQNIQAALGFLSQVANVIRNA